MFNHSDIIEVDNSMKKILVMSDTHLSRDITLPDILLKHLNMVDIVIHAGDFTSYEVYSYLKRLKPLVACWGNNDDWRLKQELPDKVLVPIEGVNIGLCHGHGISIGLSRAQNTLNRAITTFSTQDVNLVIFGHSHKCQLEEINGVTYYNPGSATNKRFEPEYSFGIITVEAGKFDIKTYFYKTY